MYIQILNKRSLVRGLCVFLLFLSFGFLSRLLPGGKNCKRSEGDSSFPFCCPPSLLWFKSCNGDSLPLHCLSV